MLDVNAATVPNRSCISIPAPSFDTFMKTTVLNEVMHDATKMLQGT